MSEREVSRERPRDSESGAHPPQPPAPGSLFRKGRVGVGAIVAAVAVVGIVVWLVVESGDESGPESTPPVAYTAAGLKSYASTAGQPVFWAGPKPNTTYEVSKTTAGILVRYLPAGVSAGTAELLPTIATYSMPDAYNVTRGLSSKPDTKVSFIPRGGVASVNTTRPTSVYVAYPNVDYQVEIFDPSATRARELADSGSVVAVLGTPAAASSNTGPVAASPAKLRALAASLGHPVYWAGPRPKTTYELTQTATGWIYVRYLPKGVALGVRKPYLTVVTYPFPDAFAALRRSAAKNSDATIKLPGGIAAYKKGQGTNVHLAYQGTDVQVEVYDPSAKVPPRLVASGQIVPV